MPVDSARPAGPVPDDFFGQSSGRILKRLFHATRPKFFPASVLPVLVGTAWGVQVTGSFDTVVFFLALLATLCVHAGSNVLNDVGDESNGTDRRNEQHIYPYTGGSRFIQTGILDYSGMAKLGIGLLSIAAVAGLGLYFLKGPLVIVLGLCGASLGVLYSLGPLRLSALGLGETAVAVAFGVLPVAGAAWLQGAPLDSSAVLISVPVSAWVAAILLINEVPDIEADAASGKATLPVRLGLGGTANVYLIIHIVATVTVVYLVANSLLPILAPLAPLGLLVLAYRASVAIRAGIEDRSGMTRAIEATLGIHTLGSIWLVGCILSMLWW
jgi:1,4-dihydroxy-2-naphthoate octaprenyltransferase